MKIITGKLPKPKKILVYGPEGIGKTTFASEFPDPLFIDTEGSTGEYEVTRTEDPSSWGHMKSIVQEVIREKPCSTLVIDTIDWAEKMCVKSVCDAHQWETITDPGYGNGYSHVFNEFGRFLHILDDVIAAGINVVLTAHASLRKFEQPDERGAYDRWALKLIDTPKCSIAHMVMEWCDAMLFANYKTIVITDQKTKKTKASGGQRVMYTTHHSCWDAKNRYGLQEELPFAYDQIRKVIEVSTKAEQKPVKAEQLKQKPEPKYEPIADVISDPDPAEDPVPALNSPEPEKAPDPTDKLPEEPDKRIPKSLRDLMIQDGITEWDIQNFVEARNWMPYNTPVYQYEVAAPGFIDKALVSQWTKVRDMIRQVNKDEEVPFN